jgi:hypothetical protein
MKWILIVLAVTADSPAILAPHDIARTSMANALRSLYIERTLLKNVTDGVRFDSKGDCRAAIYAIEAHGPDPETAPDGGAYQRICKLVRKESQ